VFYRLLFLVLSLSLFAVTPATAAAALLGTGQSALFPIDVSDRGLEIVETFNTYLPNAKGVNTPEVAIQTTLSPSPYLTYKYIINGRIPYVQSLTQTPFNTLLIVSYLSEQLPTSLQYVVLPVENVQMLLTFPTYYQLPSSNAPFTSMFSPTTVPFFAIDPKKRGSDIVSAFKKLMAAPFATATSQVWIQTTLNGPFRPPLAMNGSNQVLLKNVKRIDFSSNASGATSLLYVTFLPPDQSTDLKIVLTPEQVQQVIYVLYPQSPNG
jgi:hypothetical protein